ncbi:HAMP domain-containing protein [Aliikangiella coralliicola]|uniref:Sensor protein n=2 Tax=Aliikangiella coralliicola TaxID=2592383 RepID=A0A545UI11_9GAMM|nr:HAMP domain-containing protein [Aliikangiella coralliicola]
MMANQSMTNTQDELDKTVDQEVKFTHTSLVTRASQIMAIIVTLGLVSMVSSMLVTESLSGDAAQINNAGALRMHAIRISRAHLSDKSSDKNFIQKEIAGFEERLSHLLSGGLTSARENPDVEAQYQHILSSWERLKQTDIPTPIFSFDQFVASVDRLVTLLQTESEKKLEMLRLIQGASLFLVVIIAFVVLFRLNRLVISPLKLLVKVASEAGKGNFDIKADDSSNNELGVLARTFNKMSEELKSTYQDFEKRVAQKTRQLTHSNQSLKVLYRGARNLATKNNAEIDSEIIAELERALGYGKITIKRVCTPQNKRLIGVITPHQNIKNYCFASQQFPLEKQTQLFGYLEWQVPKNKVAEEWQTQMLQAMADIIATAFELEQKRNTDNRLLIVEERAVIARELHDSLAQSLSYLKVQMSLLTRKMQKEVAKEQVSETIDDIKQGLNKAYQQLRELLTTFRLKLEDPSIENALQGTVTEFSTKCHHPIELDFQLPQNYLTANQEIHVLQIAREALSNIQRHAQAQQAKVSLYQENDLIKLEVWDDGIGLPHQLEQHGHFGLNIMQERAKSLGAKIEFLSKKPKGTHVVVEFKH